MLRLISILFACVLLTACATGVTMTDEDAAACRAEGCTVWTERELTDLLQRAFGAGFRSGSQSRGQAL